MKLTRFAKALLLFAAALVLTQPAKSANLILDDFSTGPYQKQLASGQDVAPQAGMMIGGERETVFTVCQGPCGAQNPFDQEAAFEIRPGSPSALIYSAGYKVYPRLEVAYGVATPLQLDLGSNYNRIRVNFDGSDLVVNFNILVFTGTDYSQTGCNLAASTNPVSIDFPFADFTVGADFNNITAIDFIFQSGSAVGANDWAVTSFEAVPTDAPPAEITCHGIGT